MAQPAHNFDQPHERDSRLYVLGLDEATVVDIVLYGLKARQGVSPLGPPSFAGTTQWAETIIGARLILVPKGWAQNDSNNFSRTISPNGRVAIVVATGDERTGIATAEPATRHSKGSETEAAVEKNAQFVIPGLADTSAPTQTETWVLLLCTTDLEMRYELSRPKKQNADGRITQWSDRIIFPTIDLESLPGREDEDRGNDDDDDGPAGIVVPVERI
jgi:hypothetical protein